MVETEKLILDSDEMTLSVDKNSNININNITNKLICGNSIELLKRLPSNSVNLVITSPPYFKQRDYGLGKEEIGRERTVDDYINNLLKVFHECVRIIREDGSIVFNLGDKYQNGNLLLIPYRFAIEVLKKENVKLVNQIVWHKLNPTPRQFKRRLVNSTEPFFHFVKSKNYYYNLDAFLSSKDTDKNHRDNITKNVGKKYFELIEKSDLSPEQKDLAKKELNEVIEEVKKGKTYDFRMKIRGIHSDAFGGQDGGRKSQLLSKGFTIIKMHGNHIKKDIIESPVESLKGIQHPAIYPEYLISELLKLLTKEGDIVLDPFIGSGTTAVACKKLNRKYIGFDLNPKYIEIAKKRLLKLNINKTLEGYINGKEQ